MQFKQIVFAIWTNTFYNLNKKFLQFGKIIFTKCSWVGKDIHLRANNNFAGIRCRPRFFGSDWSWKEPERGFVPVFRSNLWTFWPRNSCTSLMMGDEVWPIWYFWRLNNGNENEIEVFDNNRNGAYKVGGVVFHNVWWCILHKFGQRHFESGLFGIF